MSSHNGKEGHSAVHRVLVLRMCSWSESYIGKATKEEMRIKLTKT